MESGNPGELIALALKRAGVSHLFTLNGAHIWSVLTAAAEMGMRVIDTRHEQSAAFAAERPLREVLYAMPKGGVDESLSLDFF